MVKIEPRSRAPRRLAPRLVAALILLVALAGSASVPAQEASTVVSSLQLVSPSVPRGTPVSGYGTVTFGSDFQVVATDPPADIDAARAAAGMDLTRLTIASDPAKPNDMVWTYELASLPGNGGTPEVVFYWWRFQIDGGEELALDARYSNVYRQLNLNQFFRVRRCPGGSCTDVATPQGSFDQPNGRIAATLRVNTLPGAQGGSTISFGTIESSVGTGPRWVYGQGDSASPDVDYAIPFADVNVGLAPPGLQPGSWTAATVTGAGASRSFSLSAPTAGFGAGAYDLVVRACWGANCGEARASVTLT